MKRQKMKMYLPMMWMGVFIAVVMLFAVMLGLVSDGNVVMAIIYTIIMSLVIVLILVDGFGRVNRCYIEMGNNQLTVVRSVKKLKSDNRSPEGKWIRKEDTFDVNDIVRIGYSSDIYKRRMEFQRDVGYKAYPWEVVFELENQETVVVNLGWFSVKAQKEIFNYIYERTGLWPVGELTKVIGKREDKRKDGTLKKVKFGNQYDINNKEGTRGEIDSKILFQYKLEPISKEEAEKYSQLWIKKIKAKKWRFSLFLCLAIMPLIIPSYLLGAIDIEMRNLSYMLGGVFLPLIIGFTFFFQRAAKKQVISFEETPYERGLCAIIEYTGKYKPICVQYVADGEIIEEYLNENSVCGELQVGQYATLIMVKDTPEHLLCQDISWAGM